MFLYSFGWDCLHTQLSIRIYLQVVTFVIMIHFMQGWTATLRHGVTRKISTKRFKHTGNMFRKYMDNIYSLQTSPNFKMCRSLTVSGKIMCG